MPAFGFPPELRETLNKFRFLCSTWSLSERITGNTKEEDAVIQNECGKYNTKGKTGDSEKQR